MLKYCECVIKESLRLTPTVPISGRFCYKKSTIMGHIIEPGVSIFIIFIYCFILYFFILFFIYFYTIYFILIVKFKIYLFIFLKVVQFF